MSSEEENSDSLIYEIVADRFQQEWRRTNDLDSKANNVTGFAGLLATLSGGITAGLTQIYPKMHHTNLFIIPLIVFVVSAFFGLMSYWLTSFSAIDPEALIREYKNKTKTEVIRRVAPTISILTMENFQRNQRKVICLYLAFSLLVAAIALFFAVTIVNIVY